MSLYADYDENKLFQLCLNRIKYKGRNEHSKVEYNPSGTENHCQKGILNSEKEVPKIQFPSLSDVPFIKHGFSTRLGGYSSGCYGTMNLGLFLGDKKELVSANFERFCGSINIEAQNLVFSDQVHSNKIQVVNQEHIGNKGNSVNSLRETDGMITNQKGLPLVTFYADCVPLYFVDPVHRAIGLAHSGWKGTASRIGCEVVRGMRKEYGTDPKDLIAVIGPSICEECYEVSEDVAKIFYQIFSEDVCRLVLEKKENGKYQLDLWLANRYILQQAGILEKNISVSNICTCCNSDLFFSHRASKGKRGLLAAFLSLC